MRHKSEPSLHQSYTVVKNVACLLEELPQGVLDLIQDILRVVVPSRDRSRHSHTLQRSHIIALSFKEEKQLSSVDDINFALNAIMVESFEEGYKSAQHGESFRGTVRSSPVNIFEHSFEEALLDHV